MNQSYFFSLDTIEIASLKISFKLKVGKLKLAGHLDLDTRLLLIKWELDKGEILLSVLSLWRL